MINKALLVKAAAVAGLVSFAAPASATTFFTNFDSTNFGAGAGYVILPSYEGWTANPFLAGVNGIEVQYNNVAGLAFSGPNLVELDAGGNSTMERGITAGNYTLTFQYSARPGIGLASNGIDVLLNGSSIFNVSGAGGSGTSWALQTVNFTAFGPGTLSFSAIGTSDSLGGYLDDINLAAAVPEPGSWMMLLAGFGLIGTQLRRRDRRAQFA